MVTEPSPTSSPRPGAKGRESEARRVVTPAPVLASEILREDVAPLAPWSKEFRAWDVAFALAVVALGVGAHVHLIVPTTGGPWLEYVLGAVLLVLALPRSYLARGIGSMILGLLVAALGLAKVGPLGNWVPAEGSTISSVLHFVAMMALPAALLFRNRYPAYVGARVTLLVAYVVTIPAVVFAVLAVAQGPLAASIAAGVTLAVIAVSLVGFLGEGTTGFSTLLAVLVIVAFGAERMARPLWAQGWEGSQVDLRAGLSLMIAAGLASKGLFALLASAFATDARRVDVMRVRQPSLNRASGTDL
jgi:hypothetical protein